MSPSVPTTTGAVATSSSPSKATAPSAPNANEVLANLILSDPLIAEYDLTSHTSGEQQKYAAALLAKQNSSHDVSSDTLGEVDQKLNVIKTAIDDLVRERPAEIARPFLTLHGYDVASDGEHAPKRTSGNLAPISTTRERCDRLRRQGDLVLSISQRVESSLMTRGLHQIEKSTTKLERLLDLSAALKQIMRLKFETTKIRQAQHLWQERESAGSSNKSLMLIDLRDLIRVSSSVASVEALFRELECEGQESIAIIEKLRPEANAAAAAVRSAAAELLAQQEGSDMDYSSALGATLQVYFHLGELGDAVWGRTSELLNAAEKASSQLLNPGNMQRLRDSAKIEANKVGAKRGEAERVLAKKLLEKRAEAASKWASGVSDAAINVLTIQSVLARKTDAVSRKRFADVVAASSCPDKFSQAATELSKNSNHFSLFDYFWKQFCIILGARIQRLLKFENGALGEDVAALYPPIRASASEMLGRLAGAIQAGSANSNVDGSDFNNSISENGILGGSNMLLTDSMFLGWKDTSPGSGNYDESSIVYGGNNLGLTYANMSADRWTRSIGPTKEEDYVSSVHAFSSSTFSIVNKEWSVLQGVGGSGLQPLRDAFLDASTHRLRKPLRTFFMENVSVDEDGIAMVSSNLPTIPSSYDLSLVEKVILSELSLADPREGGGNFCMASMISSNVVDMVRELCNEARKATSLAVSADDGINSQGATMDFHYVRSDGSLTENLSHDLKLADFMNNLSTLIKKAPEKAFVLPYRPAVLPQHEECARKCATSLTPAIREIDKLVDSFILSPFGRTLNKQMSAAISKMHAGAYLEDSDRKSFVQQHVGVLLDTIAVNHLSSLPQSYAVALSAKIASHTIYSFISNMALIRPLGENGRLRITQDLADIELCLEQFILSGGSSSSLSQMDGGRPYAELRAARQMIYWNGFDDKTASPVEICKGILREPWIPNVRPSTVLNFLFSFAPDLLSSPHESKNKKIDEYVSMLLEDGETNSWIITMACCDAFYQRESVSAANVGTGDRRVANVLMQLGQELLRRRK